MDIRKEFEDYLFEVMNKFTYQENRKIENLTQNEQECVRLWRLEADMNNGGFMQFFCNWGADNFLETQKVLEKINAINSLEIITECELIISKCQEDERLVAWWDIPAILEEYITKEEKERIFELEKFYWTDPDDIMKLAYDFYSKK